MNIVDLHPEHLVDRERAGTLSAADASRLDAHRARCAVCAVERALADDFALEPDEDERARAAALVTAMFERGAPLEEQAPAPPRAPARAWHWVVASSALHAALLLLAILVVDPPAPAALDGGIPIELAILAPAPSVSSDTGMPAELAADAVAPSVAPTRAEWARQPAVAARSSIVAIEPAVTPGAAIAPEPTSVPEPTASSAAERARIAAMLDPARVARGSFVFDGAPSTRGAPAPRALVDRGPDAREIERRLGEGLRIEAMTKRHTTREHPQLRRRSDGSHVYAGSRFTAVIEPDGSVVFQDRPAVATNGFSASGTFDLTEAMMGAAGQDPLRAERDWFMRETEELRYRLELEHRRAESAAGLRRLRGRLSRVWSTTSRSAASRRRRIFALWDEAAEDDLGREARRIIVEFVREVLPAGSEDAYTEDELARLNASRESEQPFAPY